MDEQKTAYAPPVQNKRVEPPAGETFPIGSHFADDRGLLRRSGASCRGRSRRADCIGDEPATVVEIARTTGAHADSLGRILKLLSAHGIFRFNNGQVSHNEPSRTLRSDHPQSTRDLARMFGVPVFWETFAALDHSVRTGRPAVERVHPEGLWAWLSERPEASAVFNGAMIGKSFGQVASVIASYDFSRFNTIADVGGGLGHHPWQMASD